MFTKKLTDLFTTDLLNAVSGVLGEAKKCSDCGCAKCKCDDAEDDAEETKEGYIPTQRNLTARDNETIGKLAALMKKEREAKEKKEPNGVKTEEVEELEEKRGLWDNIHAKRKRIKAGSGERMRKPGSEGAPTAADFKASQKEEVEIDEVAPPGAKYERMVKHIKKAYAKDGKLTDKEKGIAYATAWKAKNEAIDPGLEHELMSQRQGESGKKWRVDHNGKTISTHNSKDAADVKAMKHPSYKVKANEEVEIEEAVGDITVKKLSPDEAFKKHTGQNVKKTSVPKDPKTGKTLYQKVTSEEVEDLDEALDSMSDAKIKYHATKNVPHGKYTPKEINAEHKRRMKAVPNYHTVKPSLSEDAEQIDEISKEALGSYTVNAARSAGDQGIIAGLKIKSGEDASKQFRKLKNRQKGIETATSRLTQEEQEFIDSLNAMDLDEARGRPKKNAGKDYTVNPRTKEKLYHDNPEHMARIEKLQKYGVIAKPKTEASQHIINQLSKAKTSMRGGETIHFTHGESQHVSGTHAAKLLDKYHGMKPDEKEAFQKKIGHSHAKLKSEL